MTTTQQTMDRALLDAGWTLQPNGKWRSPLTQHEHPHAAAFLLATLPTLTTLANVQRKQRRQRFFNRR